MALVGADDEEGDFNDGIEEEDDEEVEEEVARGFTCKMASSPCPSARLRCTMSFVSSCRYSR
eukprot:CAMPEP_0171680048 /NCGR_PEP_ID=MMETSP0990-20121206/56614_1 /TAXON_ID=483369 /ORGANISM="non described non described, Strain CCMP2098" /LENGTH=61 /DNA_ID=CAMNT_0012266977 /DNA_START=662 /DNA_END=847 /DNA_ORIENTATION=-